jgi:hypothetical protein
MQCLIPLFNAEVDNLVAANHIPAGPYAHTCL